ncbi:hypothetical protein [Nocardia asiatica]
MSRRDLVQALCRSMPDQDNVVAYPDHPLLVRGPDVLARDDRGLVAYFVYAARDPRPGSASGRARTLLSRLAFPEGTEFVLVGDPQDFVLEDADVELFDAIRYGTHTARSHRSNLEPSGFLPRGVVAELRPFHMRRFGDAWAMRDGDEPASSLMRENVSTEAPPRGMPIAYVSQRIAGRSPRLPDSIAFDNGQLYASAPVMAHGRAAVIRHVAQWISAAVDFDYSPALDSLSAAVAALHSHEAYLPLHHARTGPPAEGSASDILKPYRAAAFAGFHTMIGGG